MSSEKRINTLDDFASALMGGDDKEFSLSEHERTFQLLVEKIEEVAIAMKEEANLFQIGAPPTAIRILRPSTKKLWGECHDYLTLLKTDLDRLEKMANSGDDEKLDRAKRALKIVAGNIHYIEPLAGIDEKKT